MMDSGRIFQMCQLLDCTCGLQMAYTPRKQDDLLALFRSKAPDIFDILVRDENPSFREILETPARADTIYEFTTPGDVLFLTYGHQKSLFVFGPILTRPFSADYLLPTLQRYKFLPQTEAVILEFVRTIPYIPAERVYKIVETALRQLLELEQPLKIMQANTIYSLESILSTPLPGISTDISIMRQIATRYEFGTALLEAIKQGNSSLAFHIVGQYTPGTETAIRNPNPLRNAQNYCIVFNTQLRQAMEQCGIHPYRVDKLSNEIGLQIEQLTEVSKMKDFFAYMIRRYCQLVHKHAYPNLDPLSNLAVEYIKEHLSESITVKDTAKALTVNADYLSAQFHRHMSISFIDFVNRERIQQAAALLGNTQLQIQQISQIVGYNNTSYFAKQFNRYMGVSPREYRRQHYPKA